MLGFMGVTAFLSMWISNTATTAMMVPIVQAVLDQLNGNVDPQPSPKSPRRSVVLHREHEEKTSSILQTGASNMLENGMIDAMCCLLDPHRSDILLWKNQHSIPRNYMHIGQIFRAPFI